MEVGSPGVSAGPGQGSAVCSGGKQGHQMSVQTSRGGREGLDISGAGHDFPSLYLVFWRWEGANRTTTSCEGWAPLLVSSRMMRVSSLQSTSGEMTNSSRLGSLQGQQQNF